MAKPGPVVRCVKCGRRREPVGYPVRVAGDLRDLGCRRCAEQEYREEALGIHNARQLSPLETRCEEIRLGRLRRRRWMFQAGQWVATALAITGVLLNNAQRRWCFPLWVVSNAITLGYHVRARLWGLACRDCVFLVLAVIGWFMWG